MSFLFFSTLGCSNVSSFYTGSDKRGCLVEWVEKAAFDRLNQLYQISSLEMNHHTFLSAWNLRMVV